QDQHETCGQAILYFQKDRDAAKLQYGDIVTVKNVFQPIAAPKNPDEFDYRKFLYYHNIYTSGYLKREDWRLTPLHRVNPLYALTFSLREKSIQAFQKYIPGGRESAVAEAILVGYRDDLDDDVRQSYAAAGVIHVLVVAGLHVGILY